MNLNEASENQSKGDMRRLSAGMSVSDRMLPLLTGQVTMPEIKLNFEFDTPNALFWRALHDGAFDLTEMSLAAHAILTSRDANPFVGLPVFTSRMFRHGSIFVSATSDISHPEHLAGRRIGVPEYQMTAAVWMRGILQDHHDVTPTNIHWFTGGVNQPGRKERIALHRPANLRVEPISERATLNGMLLAGEIDAIIAPQIPQAFHQGDARIKRLFGNGREIEEAYFAETKIFPIMHLAVVRRELVAAEPELADTLFQLFDAARRHAMATLCDTDAPSVMMPWQADEIARTQALMGDDYWAYGIDANRHVLETFVRYLGEQELLARPIEVDELFAPATYAYAGA